MVCLFQVTKSSWLKMCQGFTIRLQQFEIVEERCGNKLVAQIRVEGVDDSENYVSKAGTSDEATYNFHGVTRTTYNDIYGIYVDNASSRELDDNLTWLYAPKPRIGSYVERIPTPCRPEPIAIEKLLDAPPGFELRIMDPPHRPSYIDDDKYAFLAIMV